MTQTLPPTIHAAEVRALVEGGRSARLLDVRTPGEFAARHIAGAVNIPLDQLAPVAASLADGAGTLIVICQSGGRAEQACATLTRAGVASTLMTGGMNAWNAAGGPGNSAKGVWSLERQVRFVAGLIVLTAILVSIAWEPARYLAGMIGAGLVFSSVTNTCTMGLLLAKLPFNKGSACSIDGAVAALRR
ncbi:MAG: rhodanese-like domain-containing protein [Sporichthyaceae bacterium]